MSLILSSSSVIENEAGTIPQGVRRDMLIYPTKKFSPPIIAGIRVSRKNPLKFNTIIDTGDFNIKGEEFNQIAKKLMGYFASSFLIREEDLWVNLSAYESNRMIPDVLFGTEMGKDMLAGDCLLKRFTASLMHPETELGRQYWDAVFARMHSKKGGLKNEINAFQKVWIVPSVAEVYVKEQGEDVPEKFSHWGLRKSEYAAFVVNRYLEVKCEKDMKAHKKREEEENANIDADYDICLPIFKEKILPVIEKEINEGETFANFRQIYNSMILATWYKKTFKRSPIASSYIDSNNTNSLQVNIGEVKKIPKRSMIKRETVRKYFKILNVDIMDYLVFLREKGFDIDWKDSSDGKLKALIRYKDKISGYVNPLSTGVGFSVNLKVIKMTRSLSKVRQIRHFGQRKHHTSKIILAEVIIQKAKFLRKLKKYEEAISLCKKAHAIDKTNPYPFNVIGTCLADQNDNYAAIENYHKALEVNNGVTRAWMNLGNRYLNLNNLQKAKEYYEKAIIINSLSPKEEAFKELAKNSLNKINSSIENDPQKYYQEYLELFRNGVYHHIGEFMDPVKKSMISRSFFSGGMNLTSISNDLLVSSESLLTD